MQGDSAWCAREPGVVRVLAHSVEGCWLRRVAQVYPLELAEHPVEYATRLPENMDRASVSPPIAVEAHSLEYTMKALNHSWIDILRIGGHTSLHEDIFASWFRQKSTPPICQVTRLCFTLPDPVRSRAPDVRRPFPWFHCTRITSAKPGYGWFLGRITCSQGFQAGFFLEVRHSTVPLRMGLPRRALSQRCRSLPPR